MGGENVERVARAGGVHRAQERAVVHGLRVVVVRRRQRATDDARVGIDGVDARGRDFEQRGVGGRVGRAIAPLAREVRLVPDDVRGDAPAIPLGDRSDEIAVIVEVVRRRVERGGIRLRPARRLVQPRDDTQVVIVGGAQEPIGVLPMELAARRLDVAPREHLHDGLRAQVADLLQCGVVRAQGVNAERQRAPARAPHERKGGG